MDAGQILLYGRLILGAFAAFLVIMLWSKTRDAAWMLAAVGAMIAFAEVVYPVFEMAGITANALYIGSVPFWATFLPSLRLAFFAAAFLVMVIKRYR